MSDPSVRPIGTVSSAVRRAVYAIHPELEAIVDAALLPLDRPLVLCPECAVRHAIEERGTVRVGWCRVCVLRAFAQRYEEQEAELRARTIANAAKKRLERTRNELEPDRRRAHPPFRVCAACGERLPKREAYDFDYCPECRDLHERRGVADAGPRES